MALLRSRGFHPLFVALSMMASQHAAAQDSIGHAILSDPEGEPIIIGSAHRIRSSVYGDEQLLSVRLPRGYHDDPARSYPVVFSVDGGPDQDFEILSGIAAEAEFSTCFQPFILIGVQTRDRSRQLTPEWTRLDRKRLTEAFGERMEPGGATASGSTWSGMFCLGQPLATEPIERFSPQHLSAACSCSTHS